MATIIYDDQCVICCYLADFLGRHLDSAWSIVGSSRYDKTPPDIAQTELIVFDGQVYHSGADAWEYLIRHAPLLHQFRWLVERLGLVRPAARQLRHAGHGLRRLCRNCRN